MRVKAKGKVVPTSFQKVVGTGDTCWGGRTEKGGQLIGLVADQNLSSEAPPRCKRRRRKVRRGATSREAMEKGRSAKVIEGKKVRRDDPIKYFSSTGVRSTL